MKYIKRFFEINESKSNDSDEINITNALNKIMGKGEYIIEFNNPNQAKVLRANFTLKKRETDQDEIKEHKDRLESVARNRGDISQEDIDNYLNNLSTGFYLEDVKEFRNYLDKHYFTQYDENDEDDYIYELNVNIRKKKITKEGVGEYVTTNLAYLNDEYPFEIRLSEVNFGNDMTSDSYQNVYTCEILFDEEIDLDSVKDYLIPFLYKAESEGMLYTFSNKGNHGCIYVMGRINKFYTIDDLDKESNFVMGKKNYTLQIMFDS